MKSKAAFVNSVTGNTHGWTTHHVWSPETLERLKKLRESMELDLAAAHFLDVGEAPQAEVEETGTTTESSGGLGEHLGRRMQDADPID